MKDGVKFIDILMKRGEQPQEQWLTLYREGRYVSFSIEELMCRVQAYVVLYRKKSLKRGDVVLIILEQSLDIFAAFFAGIVTGVLPAFYAYPSPKQSQERFLEHMSDLVKFNEIALIISYDQVIRTLERTSFFKDHPEFGGCVFADQVATVPFDLGSLRREQVGEAFLQFSSGTTGAKKGVKITVSALFNQICAYEKTIFLDGHSRVVSWLPHYHDMGLIACMLMPFIKGAGIFMISPFEWVRCPEMLFKMISTVKGTHVWLPNFALGHLVNRIPPDQVVQYDLGSLKQIVLCSEPVIFSTVDRFLKHFQSSGIRADQVGNCYAMAENTFAMTTTAAGAGIRFLRLDQETLRRSNKAVEAVDGRVSVVASCGRLLPNIRIRILDVSGGECPERGVGLIHIQSDCMLKEYHRNPEETAQAISDDGWFNTGDLGFMDRGELFVTGRQKELIIVGGENIYPQDIEEILNNHSDLLPGRNVVFGFFYESVGTEKIVVLAEVRDEVRLSPAREQLCADLRKAVLDRLNVSLSDIVLLPPQTLKKSTAGKISRHLNKEVYLEGGFQERLTPTVRPVATGPLFLSAVKELLRARGIDEASISAVTPNTKLISSGLIDSFAFIELVLRIEGIAGVKVLPELMRPEHFDTLIDIEKTVRRVSNSMEISSEETDLLRQKSLDRLLAQPMAGISQTWREWLVERFPWPTSKLYFLLWRMIGLKVSWETTFLGNIRLKLRGAPGHIVIEEGVRIAKGVDLRIREDGKIFLRRKVYLDNDVRLVAARDGLIELKEGAEIGFQTIINSGGAVSIGRFSMIAGRVVINSSSHGVGRDAFIKEQPHRHGRVDIGDDVWIGTGASILIDTVIDEGVVIASNALVSGHIPAFAVCAGAPAKVLYYR